MYDFPYATKILLYSNQDDDVEKICLHKKYNNYCKLYTNILSRFD